MGKANFTEDFKRDAVLQVTERGYPVAEVAARLGISKYSLYEWKKRYAKPAAATSTTLGATGRIALIAVEGSPLQAFRCTVLGISAAQRTRQCSMSRG